MNWLNIDVMALRSPEFIGADPIARATWLCLLGYCADQENGGVIENCIDWGDRRWMQTCAVTRAEIDASHPLAFWDASALHVAFYPLDQEVKFKANRKNGKLGGRPKGLSEQKPDGKPNKNHMVQSGVNVKEEKRKEKKEKGNTLLPNVKSEIESQFEEFWKVYPKRVDRKPAFQKFVKALRNHGFEKVMQGLRNSLPLFELKGLQFTKNPASWLNQESYLNDFMDIQKQIEAEKEQIERSKPKEKTIWHQCLIRCDNWDNNAGWCKKRVKVEPVKVEACQFF